MSPDNPVWVAFARAMGPVMRLPAELLAGLVGGDAGQPLRVLDVAAGHGLFGIAVARRYPKATVTALDWPAVLAVAAENARAAGVADRHALLPGDAFDDRLGRAVRRGAADQLPAPLRPADVRATGGEGLRPPWPPAGGR